MRHRRWPSSQGTSSIGCAQCIQQALNTGETTASLVPRLLAPGQSPHQSPRALETQNASPPSPWLPVCSALRPPGGGLPALESASLRASGLPEKHPSLLHRFLPAGWSQPQGPLQSPQVAPTCGPIWKALQTSHKGPSFTWEARLLPLVHPVLLHHLKCPEHMTMERLGTGLRPDAVGGTGDPWVKVTGRSRSQTPQ